MRKGFIAIICKKFDINSILVPLFLTVTFGVFGPLSLYITNINEFWFSINDIWLITVLVGSGLFILGFGISFLFSKKGRDIYFCSIFGLALGFYIQGNYINVDYGILDGKSIDWGIYTNVAIVNTIVWLICMSLPFVIYFLTPKVWKNVVLYGSAFITLIQIVTLAVLFTTTDLSKNEIKAYITNEGKFNLSKNKNVVIFVLDAFDSSYFQQLLVEYPELENSFDDFSFYPDTVGGATRTTIALPAILTGQAWTDPVSYSEYLDIAYSKTELYRVLKANNYDTRIYVKSSYVPYSQRDYIHNLSSGHGVISSYSLLARHLYNFTAFRYMPHILKSKFWFYSGVFDEIFCGSGASSYNVNDIDFYRKLLSDKISTNVEGNAFRLYHLLGAHPPFILNEYAEEVPSDSTTQLKQARGVLHIIEEYISQLKEEGIYDNTAIIIMADHGDVYYEQNPLFMIKTFNEDKDFQIIYSPISYYDLHTTLLSMITNKSKYNDTIFNIKEGDKRTRLFYRLSSEDGLSIYEYQVNGYAGDKKAISATGNAYYGNKESYTYEYKLGTLLNFGSTGNATEYLIDGFSTGSAAGHTWTNDTTARIKLVLDKKPETDLVVKITAEPYTGAGRQRMIVTVSDEIMLSWAYINTSNIEFTIPKELLDKNELVIDFQFPDAVCPQRLFGPGYDSRTLAFAFRSMTISEGKAESQKMIQKYALGDEIEFTEDNDGTRYFMYGIASVNGNYAWSYGKSSELIMNAGNIEKELECSIDLASVLNGRQRVIVSSNGMTLFDDVVTAENKKISFKIPTQCITSEVLSLSFSYPDANSPANLGTGKDKRILAVAFKKVVIKEYEDKIQKYTLGDEIEFTEDNDGTRYFMYGIASVNGNYAWSYGKSSELIMNAGNIEKELECSIDLASVLNGRQRVIISSNGMTLFDDVVTAENKKISFKIPTQCITSEVLSLSFSYPDANSPANLGTGKDKRILAVAFKKFIFIESV